MTASNTWYRTGTVSVTAGSKSVAGVGTLWLSQSLPGDLFALTDANGNVTSVLAEVDAVATDTALTLKSIWPVSTLSDQKYVLVRNFTGSLPADLAARLSKLIAQYQISADELTTLLTTSGAVTLTRLNGETIQTSGLLAFAEAAVSAVDAAESATSASASAAAAAAIYGDVAAVQTAAISATAKAADSAASAASASSSAASATGSAASASTSAANAAASTGAALWVSGTSYALGVVVYSPVTFRTYRRKVAGAGTTDPSTDANNWGLLTLEIDTQMPVMRPSLILDFANSRTVDPRISFSRASTATYYGADGLLKTAAANVPRINYDPLTGVCNGLLIEEARTNLLPYSDQFDNAAWIKYKSTVTSNATTAPDGTLTSDKLVADTSVADRHFWYQTASVTLGTTYTWSVFIKPGERTAIRMDAGDGQFGAGNYAEFDLVARTATAFGTAAARIENARDGFMRCSVSMIATGTSAPCAFTVELRSGATVTYTGDGTSGIYVWGAQLEVGAFPTSYIPTTSAGVTRAADVAVMTGANFSGWYRPSEGTLVAKVLTGPVVSGARIFARIDDATNNNRMDVRTNSGGGAYASSVFSSSSTVLNVSWGTINAVSVGVGAVAYKSGDSLVCGGGALSSASTTTFATVPATQLLIGYDTSSGTSYLNGHVARVAYYPKRLSNSELLGVTTA